MKQLIAKEFVVEEGMVLPPVGSKYSFFQDPETGKYYRPKEGTSIARENLDDDFVEVPCGE